MVHGDGGYFTCWGELGCHAFNVLWCRGILNEVGIIIWVKGGWKT